jgi:crossover junction endodeoxyribonuclease RuvC
MKLTAINETPLPFGPEYGSWMGIDPSMTSTGIAVITDRVLYHYRIKCQGKGTQGVQRLLEFNHYVTQEVRDMWNPQKIGIEGYAFGTHNTRAHSIGELGCVFKLALYDWSHPWFIAAPTVVKKFATGKGNAKKGQVQVGLFKKWKLDIQDEDEADATVLALMAMYHDKLLTPDSPAVREYERETLLKVEHQPFRGGRNRELG